jgi:hypothetical protein
LVEACLVDFGCIDTIQPISRVIQLERIAISHNNFVRQAWPGHRQQQRRNESAHVQPRLRVGDSGSVEKLSCRRGDHNRISVRINAIEPL